jgi:sugar-specific transcriptional regulator TrmB
MQKTQQNMKSKGSSGDPALELSLDLQRLGFSDYEARIYLCLLTLQPATAYEVSKVAGLPRSNTYSGLESLKKKGAVQPVTENPVRFVTVDPGDLFGQVARDVRSVCDRLARSLPALRRNDGPDVIWTVTGTRNIEDKINELIESAEQHIWIKAAAHILEPHTEALKRAAERGVELLIILFGTDPGPFRFNSNCRVYLHEGNGVRMGGADNLFTVTSDYKVALTARLAGDETIGAHTNSDPIVRMAETLIRHDYYLAEIFQKFGPELDREFGPFLVSLRQKTFSPDQFAILEDNLRSIEPGAAPEAAPASGKRKPARRRAAAAAGKS